MALLFCVRSGIAFFSTVCAIAAAREDAYTNVVSEQPEPVGAAMGGVSLMQSGRSVLPVAAEKVLHLNEFSVDSADDFATMEDEFDVGLDIPYVAADARRDWLAEADQKLPFVCVTEHFTDPFLYLETLLVVGLFALARRFALWVRKAISEKPTSLASAIEACHPDAPCPAPGVDFKTLEKAIRDGDEALCKTLLERKGRTAVRLEDACGCTALHVAAHCGSAAIARLLLGHNANVHAREAWEDTPLHIAARAGANEVCEVLLAYGSEIDAVNAQGQTPLLLAAESQAEATCELLLSRGGGVAGVDDCSLPPLLKSLLFRRVLCSGASAHEPPEAMLLASHD